MAEFDVEVSVSGPPASSAEDAERIVAERAAEIALGTLRDIWPVRTGRSKSGLTTRGSLVVGTAEYTDEVRRRGSSTPIVTTEAPRIGEDAAQQAADELAEQVALAIEGAVTESLRRLE